MQYRVGQKPCSTKKAQTVLQILWCCPLRDVLTVLLPDLMLLTFTPATQISYSKRACYPHETQEGKPYIYLTEADLMQEAERLANWARGAHSLFPINLLPSPFASRGEERPPKLLFVSLMGDAGNSGSSFLRFLPAKSRRLLMATSHYCWCPQRKDKRVDVCLVTPLKTPGPSPFTEHFHPDKWDTNHVYLTANE